MRILVAGAEGQVGRSLTELLGERVVWASGRHGLDVSNAEAVSYLLREIRPQVIINCAAYNNVDGAETQVDEALAANAAGPAHLARAARDIGALLVHISTDFVFDGTQNRPYTEQDPPHPLNAYGTSKLAGEMLVGSSGAEHLIVRTSAVFGSGGSKAKEGSFPERILARARSGQSLKVVADQVVSPTYAPDLAQALVLLIDHGARGLIHVTNSGSCTWHAFAVETIKYAGLNVPVEEIRARELLAPAHRPAHAILSKERYESLGLKPLRAWSDALREFVS
jgi:dTDP-4-dehydrorhamnose reductase